MDLIGALLIVLPLASAILWLAIGAWPFLRYRYASPFQRTLTAAAFLLAAYAFVDWVFLHLSWFYAPADVGSPAVLVSEVRATLLAAAVSLLFLASKWLYRGHARYDPLLVVPAAASLVVIWGGMTRDAELADWGPRLIRDTVLYAGWAGVQLAYIVGSVVMTLALFLARRDLPPRLRRRIFWSAASLLAILAAWSTTNVYNNLTATAGVPWFSSLLVVPASIIVVAFLPLSSEEIGEVYRAVSSVEEKVQALYVFYRTGEPLAAVASSRTFPIEAEQLQAILEIVGNFVETSMKKFQGYSVTAMHFDRLGIVAVRGQHLVVAAVYEGAAYDAIRSELLRGVRSFEERRWEKLETWEGATGIAEEVADELSILIKKPEAAAGHRTTTPPSGHRT